MRKMQTLKKNYEFEKVLKQGKFYVGKQITIYITKNKANKNVFGIAISKKICGAVKRNWIKRKIRENYRLLQNDLKQGFNIVFLWNKNNPVNSANFHVIKDDMLKLFKKAGLL